MARPLHFVVIGAQKAGTTTLFHHLREHPSLAMPPDKEAPFFSRGDLYPNGAEWFVEHYFARVEPGRLLGKVSPQYMCVPGTAARLASAYPAVKVVALLRDPVERARSQHAMAVRKGVEERSFDEAVSEQLLPDALVAAREGGWPSPLSVADTYVVWGEYGRVLSEYLEVLPRSQLHVMFSSRLATEPGAVVREIQEFLGVEPIAPSTLGRSFYVSGEPRSDVHRRARSSRVARRLWHRLPLKYRNRISHEYWQWNVRPGEPGQRERNVSPATVASLRRHYWSDEALLEKLLDLTVPWPRQQPVGS